MNTCNHTTIESVAAAENGMCPLCLQAAWQEKDAQVAALQTALEAANSALMSMVNQYCYRPLDANKEPSVDIYQHDFMSAGEEAFAYLVEHGLAKWTDESHYAILINSKTSLSVKSDD